MSPSPAPFPGVCCPKQPGRKGSPRAVQFVMDHRRQRYLNRGDFAALDLDLAVVARAFAGADQFDRRVAPT